jgi:hypothetical protein
MWHQVHGRAGRGIEQDLPPKFAWPTGGAAVGHSNPGTAVVERAGPGDLRVQRIRSLQAHGSGDVSSCCVGAAP